MLVAGIGLAARAATTGVEQDIVGASRRLPGPLLAIAHPLAPIALFVLPAALALRQIIRRQPRQLAEAIATGLLAAVAATVTNTALRTSSGQVLYDAITMARPGVSHLPPLDPALAGLAAFVTIIGLSGRPRWRAAVWLTVGTYSLMSLVGSRTTVLALAITLLGGRAIGLGVRYRGRLPVPAACRHRDSCRARPGGLPRRRDAAAAGQYLRVPPVRGDPAGRRAARHHRLRPGPAGGWPALPALPLAPAAGPGVAHGAAVDGPAGGAARADVLRGGSRPASALPGCGRRSRPARRRSRWPTSIIAARRSRSCGRGRTTTGSPGLGRGTAAASAPGDAPGADRGPDAAHR